MPSNKHHFAMERLWRMLHLIPRNEPGISVSELLSGLENEGFSVTRRTVERDLNESAIVFQLSCSEGVKPQRWFWAANASFDIPGVSLPEAITLGLLREVLRSLMPKSFTASLEDRFALADRKLSSGSGNRFAKWTELIAYTPPGLPFIPPAIDSRALDAIQKALLEKRKLTFTYRSPYQPEKKTYTVNPLGIHLHGQRAYLLASVAEHTAVLQFAIQRMGKTEILAEPSIPLPGFSLKDYLANGGNQSAAGDPIRLKATLNDHLASLLEETPLSPDQKITRSADKITLTATLPRSWQARFLAPLPRLRHHRDLSRRPPPPSHRTAGRNARQLQVATGSTRALACCFRRPRRKRGPKLRVGSNHDPSAIPNPISSLAGNLAGTCGMARTMIPTQYRTLFPAAGQRGRVCSCAVKQHNPAGWETRHNRNHERSR